MKDDSLEDALAKMRAEYAAELPATVTQMEDLWRRLLSAEVPPARLAELARMAHSIAGSGTTFGVPGASRAARELELFLDQFPESRGLPGSGEQATVAALLAALKQVAVER